MPISEHLTKQIVLQIMNAAITTDTTTAAGVVIDTKDYERGVYFTFAANDWTDGTYTAKIEEDDNASMTSPTNIASGSNKLIDHEGAGASLPALSALSADGDSLPRIGVHSTERYLRFSIVSTSTSTGGNIVAFCIKDGELWSTPE